MSYLDDILFLILKPVGSSKKNSFQKSLKIFFETVACALHTQMFAQSGACTTSSQSILNLFRCEFFSATARFVLSGTD